MKRFLNWLIAKLDKATNYFDAKLNLWYAIFLLISIAIDFGFNAPESLAWFSYSLPLLYTIGAALTILLGNILPDIKAFIQVINESEKSENAEIADQLRNIPPTIKGFSKIAFYGAVQVLCLASMLGGIVGFIYASAWLNELAAGITEGVVLAVITVSGFAGTAAKDWLDMLATKQQALKEQHHAIKEKNNQSDDFHFIYQKLQQAQYHFSDAVDKILMQTVNSRSYLVRWLKLGLPVNHIATENIADNIKNEALYKFVCGFFFDEQQIQQVVSLATIQVKVITHPQWRQWCELFSDDENQVEEILSIANISSENIKLSNFKPRFQPGYLHTAIEQKLLLPEATIQLMPHHIDAIKEGSNVRVLLEARSIVTSADLEGVNLLELTRDEVDFINQLELPKLESLLTEITWKRLVSNANPALLQTIGAVDIQYFLTNVETEDFVKRKFIQDLLSVKTETESKDFICQYQRPAAHTLFATPAYRQ